MSEPTIAQKSPIPVEVEAGKDYWWCSCGQSKNQPFCDGSHKGSDFVPKKFTAEKTGDAVGDGTSTNALAAARLLASTESEYAVRLVRTPDELHAAQVLRFEVFNLELGEGVAHQVGERESMIGS